MVTPLYKLTITLFALAILTPNIAAVVGGFEDWPFTPAPMFAHYLGPGSERYSFTFKGEFSDGSTKQVGYYSVGANWSLLRFFFKYVYGAAGRKSVFTQFPADSKEQFEERLSIFFSAFAKEYERRNPASALKRLNLVVNKLLPEATAEGEAHRVGYYSVSEGRFRHTWPNGRDL